MAEITANDIYDFFDGTTKIIKEYEVGKEIFRRSLTKSGEVSKLSNLNGFIAENWHDLTFNFNAKMAHSPYYAQTLNECTKNSVDIGIFDRTGQMVVPVQSKYGATVKATNQYFNRGNYGNQVRLVPDGQQKYVHGAVNKVTAPDGVSSDPLTKGKAVEMQNRMQDGTFNQYQAAQFAQGMAVQAAKAGLIGAALYATTETITSYKNWKNGELTTEEYLKEIGKAAGDGGVTGVATSVIMVPITIGLAAAGIACPMITIPVSIVVGAAVSKIVAPMFGRGDYKKILGEAKYYQNLMECHADLEYAIDCAAQQFADFAQDYVNQLAMHESLNQVNGYYRIQHQNANTVLADQQNAINSTMQELGSLYAKI